MADVVDWPEQDERVRAIESVRAVTNEQQYVDPVGSLVEPTAAQSELAAVLLGDSQWKVSGETGEIAAVQACRWTELRFVFVEGYEQRFELADTDSTSSLTSSLPFRSLTETHCCEHLFRPR